MKFENICNYNSGKSLIPDVPEWVRNRTLKQLHEPFILASDKSLAFGHLIADSTSVAILNSLAGEMSAALMQQYLVKRGDRTPNPAGDSVFAIELTHLRMQCILSNVCKPDKHYTKAFEACVTLMVAKRVKRRGLFVSKSNSDTPVAILTLLDLILSLIHHPGMGSSCGIFKQLEEDFAIRKVATAYGMFVALCACPKNMRLPFLLCYCSGYHETGIFLMEDVSVLMHHFDSRNDWRDLVFSKECFSVFSSRIVNVRYLRARVAHARHMIYFATGHNLPRAYYGSHNSHLTDVCDTFTNVPVVNYIGTYKRVRHLMLSEGVVNFKLLDFGFTLASNICCKDINYSNLHAYSLPSLQVNRSNRMFYWGKSRRLIEMQWGGSGLNPTHSEVIEPTGVFLDVPNCMVFSPCLGHGYYFMLNHLLGSEAIVTNPAYDVFCIAEIGLTSCDVMRKYNAMIRLEELSRNIERVDHIAAGPRTSLLHSPVSVKKFKSDGAYFATMYMGVKLVAVFKFKGVIMEWVPICCDAYDAENLHKFDPVKLFVSGESFHEVPDKMIFKYRFETYNPYSLAHTKAPKTAMELTMPSPIVELNTGHASVINYAYIKTGAYFRSSLTASSHGYSSRSLIHRRRCVMKISITNFRHFLSSLEFVPVTAKENADFSRNTNQHQGWAVQVVHHD